jgi:hypothetical protein
MDFHVVHATSEMPSYMEKQKRRSILLLVLNLENIDIVKSLLIDKSLYGLKSSAARFHEHLSESLLRLGLRRPSMILIYGWWTRHHMINI